MKWLSGLPGIRICYKTLGEKKGVFQISSKHPWKEGLCPLGRTPLSSWFSASFRQSFPPMRHKICRPTFLCFTNAMLERRWSSKTASKISLQTAEAPFLHAAKKQRKPAEGTSLKSKYIVSSYTRCIALSDEIPVWLNLLRSE